MSIIVLVTIVVIVVIIIPVRRRRILLTMVIPVIMVTRVIIVVIVIILVSLIILILLMKTPFGATLSAGRVEKSMYIPNNINIINNSSRHMCDYLLIPGSQTISLISYTLA